MQLLFLYRNHQITFERTLCGAKLVIDGHLCAEYPDGFLSQIRKFRLEGTALNPDGSLEAIGMEITPGLFLDTATLICNGKAMESRKFRGWFK